MILQSFNIIKIKNAIMESIKDFFTVLPIHACFLISLFISGYIACYAIIDDKKKMYAIMLLLSLMWIGCGVFVWILATHPEWIIIPLFILFVCYPLIRIFFECN